MEGEVEDELRRPFRVPIVLRDVVEHDQLHQRQSPAGPRCEPAWGAFSLSTNRGVVPFSGQAEAASHRLRKVYNAALGQEEARCPGVNRSLLA